MNKKQEYQSIIAIIRWFFGWAKAGESGDYDQKKRVEELTNKLSEIGKEISEPAP